MNKLKLIALIGLHSLFLSESVHAALNPSQPLSEAPPKSVFLEWAKPIEPFQMAPQVWYVGTDNLTSILITTSKGHVLIDGGLDESGKLIENNIERMGFQVKDIKYILNSHARLDQAGGIAYLKKISGAKVVSNKINAAQLVLGGAEDFALGDKLLFPPVDVDVYINDGEDIELGGVIFTSLFTPGHLPGSNSWVIKLNNGDKLIYADSLSTPGYYLVNNLNYPEIIEDLQYSYDVLSSQEIDIFVASKGDRFNLKSKLESLKNGNKKAFYDANGLSLYVTNSRMSLISQLH